MAMTHTESDRHLDTRADRAPGKTLDVIALVLMIVGGLNWGLVGLFQFDLVATLFGEMSMLSRIVYVLVGAAALYGVVTMTHLLRKR